MENLGFLEKAEIFCRTLLDLMNFSVGLRVLRSKIDLNHTNNIA